MTNHAIWLAALALVVAGTLPAAPPPVDDIETITRDQIDRSGAATLAELLRYLPQTSVGIPVSSLNSPGEFPRFDAFGLGATRMVVFIDGRPAPISASSGANLAAIPLALVERIEFDPSGSLPARGSGAVGPTLNIVMRRVARGGVVSLGAGAPTQSGGDQAQLAGLFGHSGARGSFSVGFAQESTDRVQSPDRPWSGGRLASINANNFTRTLQSGSDSYLSGSLLSHPVNGAVVPGGCSGPGFAVEGSGSTSRCRYDNNRFQSNELELRSQAANLHADWSPGDDWRLWLDASASRVRSRGDLAPPAIFNLLLRPGSPNHPALRLPGQGYDPNQVLMVRHRFVGFGPREQGADEDTAELRLGVEGRRSDVDWQLSAYHSESDLDQLHDSEVDPVRAAAAVTSGVYDLFDPFANPASVVEGLRLDRRSGARTARHGVDAQASGEFSAAAGGRWQLYGEYFRESLYSFDSASVGVSGSDGARSLLALGAGAEVALTDRLTGRAGLRYDHSSSFDGEPSANLGLTLELPAGGWLRVDAAHGFVAPTLAADAVRSRDDGEQWFYIGNTPACPDFGLPDDDCPVFHQAYFIDNPDLRAETHSQQRIELGWAADDRWRVAVAGFHQRVDDLVRYISTRDILLCLIDRLHGCPDGLGLLPLDATPSPSLGLGFAYDPTLQGPMYAQSGYANYGSLDIRGVDLDASLRRDFGAHGEIGAQLQLSYIDHYALSEADYAASDIAASQSLTGDPRRPQLRGWSELWWRRGDWQLAWQMRHVGDYQSVGDRYGYPNAPSRIPSWTAHDLQLRWTAPWRGELAIGVRNLFDQAPPIDPYDDTGDGIALALYDGYERTPYLRYSQRW